jgi:hypothetical protein
LAGVVLLETMLRASLSIRGSYEVLAKKKDLIAHKFERVGPCEMKLNMPLGMNMDNYGNYE